MITDDDGEAKNVTLTATLANKNPLKGVGRAELKLDPDNKNILGIDLNGDCVVLKSWSRVVTLAKLANPKHFYSHPGLIPMLCVLSLYDMVGLYTFYTSSNKLLYIFIVFISF